MRRFTAATLVLSLGMLTASAQKKETPVGVGPAPSPAPISWEFDFKYAPPKRIEVRNADGQTETYWYMLYTVTNKSMTTRQFHPLFELVTIDLRVFHTDIGISPLVFDAIKERHKITHKYLLHPTKAIGELRTGDDYARESAAIWRADDLRASEFSIYIAGLSGEARVLRNPVHDPSKPVMKTVVDDRGREHETTVNPKFFTLRKTLSLTYMLPASDKARSQIEPRLDDARWIMR